MKTIQIFSIDKTNSKQKLVSKAISYKDHHYATLVAAFSA